MSDDSASTLFVRPFGFVSETPVARRLGDRDCFIGNAAAATPDCERAFEHVLSLTLDPRQRTTHHRPLTDDERNDWNSFERAVDTAHRLLRADGETLIHCEAGISRSSAVTAAALAVDEDRHFVDALHAVQAHRPPAVPNPALHQFGVYYAAAHR